MKPPPTTHLLLTAAGVAPGGKGNKVRGAGNTAGPKVNKEGVRGKQSQSSPTVGNAVHGTVGKVSLKHVYEIAKIKQLDDRLGGLPLEKIAKTVLGTAASMGVVVVP